MAGGRLVGRLLFGCSTEKETHHFAGVISLVGLVCGCLDGGCLDGLRGVLLGGPKVLYGGQIALYPKGCSPNLAQESLQ